MLKYINLPLYSGQVENQTILITEDQISISPNIKYMFNSYRVIADIINEKFTLICLAEDESTFICRKEEDWVGTRYKECYFYHDKSNIYFRGGKIFQSDESWTTIKIWGKISVRSHKITVDNCHTIRPDPLLRVNRDKYVNIHYPCSDCNGIHIYTCFKDIYDYKQCLTTCYSGGYFENIKLNNLVDIWINDKQQIWVKYQDERPFMYSAWLPDKMKYLPEPLKRQLLYYIWLSKQLNIVKNVFVYRIFPFANFVIEQI